MLKRDAFSMLLITGLVVLQLSCGRETQQPPSTPQPEQQSPSSAQEVKESPAPSQPSAPTEPSEAAEPKEMSKLETPSPAKPPAPKAVLPNPALLNPAQATAKAPEQFKVKFETTKGDIFLEVNRAWAPRGADRFYNLVKIGYYSNAAFFRVINGFMAQFGIHGDPKVNEKWEAARINDDPVKESNVRGAVSFATAGPNTRTTQLFINYGNNSPLDRSGFAPFAKVIQGMEVVDALYKDYGEGAPQGRGPSQGLIQSQGNRYLKTQFPKLDYIKRASVVR
jgi:peptidyl-prolyl cis-trans isomerase A (cyclophilin A)